MEGHRQPFKHDILVTIASVPHQNSVYMAGACLVCQSVSLSVCLKASVPPSLDLIT